MATYQISIASGSAVSSALQISPEVTGRAQGTTVALVMPSQWTAADLLVEGSLDGTTWFPVYDSFGAPVRIVVDAGRYIVLDSSSSWGLVWMRFRSVAAGGTSDVNQAASRLLTVIVR